MSPIVRLCLSALLLFASIAQAKPLTPEQVPEPLKPWINWVLHDVQIQPDCPFLYNSYEQKRCSWPSEIRLDLTPAKGDFAVGWQTYQDSWIELPGDKAHWPLNVTVDGKAALIMDKNDTPSLKLPAGSHQIKGEFLWNAVPDNLKVPADTGLIDLRINGQTIPTPAVKDGQLWLKESETGLKRVENIQNKLDIQVFRKIIDDVPSQLLTRLVLEVSGEQRELKLPKPLLDGFIPLSLQSPLPARLEPDGRLLIQVRPGRWQIDVLARNTKALDSLTFKGGQPAAPTPVNSDQAFATQNKQWPESEIWVFEARPELRVVDIEQLDAVDPNQTNLPEEWKNLPAYRVSQGQTMVFKTIRRGDPEPEPNQLNLTRKLWLDFDGQGYTANDTISGTITRSWRLNTLPQTRLGKAALNGNNQFITQDRSGKQGIEVRSGMVSLDADSRILGSIDKISAVGWEQDFHTVRAELNLPPGWRLLAASGVDNVPDSWISRWTLLDLFLVLVAALATGRLWNPYWGGVALVTLVLIWHEPDSPHFIWLNILAATALIKVLPQGKFLKFISWYRYAFWLALIMTALPFMVQQVRIGLYPQLEKPWQIIDAQNFENNLSVEVSAPAAEAITEMKEEMAKRSAPSRYPLSPYDYSDSAADFDRIDPKAKVQTGPGLPQWQWTKVQLSWNGSVDAGQQLRLWYLSPSLTMVLNFFRVILVAALTLLMFGIAEKLNFKPLRPSLPLLLCLLLIFMIPTPDVYADIPDKSVLDELRNKLLEQPLPPDCLPSCAQIPQMKIAIKEKQLTVSLQVHAQKAVAIPLPAEYEQWFPNQVLIDGKTTLGLYREANSLWLNVGQGEHQVQLEGAVPLLSKFTLPLPLKPHWLSVENNGWQVIGLQDNHQVDDQLQFGRLNRVEQHSESVLEPGALPPFVRIERTLQLGLDWRIVTRIIRISPPGSPIILAVPLLPGESITTPGIRIKQGKAEVNIPAQQNQVQWESTLEKSDKIEFVAAETEQWIEVLKADISPIWHMESSGIAMIHLNNDGPWLPEWHPWPGEKITLQITRPAAVEGQTLTIDHSRLSIKPGQRNQEAELKISLRSSQGSQHTLTLPENAVLQSVAIGGQTQPIRQEGRKLTLPINPGKQEISVSWREAAGITNILHTPQTDLGIPSVNANLNIALGQDRWPLFTAGPKLGPAVLFWGVLVIIAMLSLGMGKIRLTPLKARHWFLLLVGLSQIPLEAAGMVVIWLLLLGWRKNLHASNVPYFNALQVSLGLLSLVSLAMLFLAVEQGLLGSPEMQIIGNQSSAFSLNWYQDRSSSTLPVATLVSVPLMVYRILMLAWSLWLAVSLLNWLKWGWNCYSSNGLWHKAVKPQESANTAASDDDIEQKTEQE